MSDSGFYINFWREFLTVDFLPKNAVVSDAQNAVLYFLRAPPAPPLPPPHKYNIKRKAVSKTLQRKSLSRPRGILGHQQKINLPPPPGTKLQVDATIACTFCISATN